MYVGTIVCVYVCVCVCVCVVCVVTAEGKVDAVTFGTGSGGTLAGKRSTKSLALPSYLGMLLN